MAASQRNGGKINGSESITWRRSMAAIYRCICAYHILHHGALRHVTALSENGEKQRNGVRISINSVSNNMCISSSVKRIGVAMA